MGLHPCEPVLSVTSDQCIPSVCFLGVLAPVEKDLRNLALSSHLKGPLTFGDTDHK